MLEPAGTWEGVVVTAWQRQGGKHLEVWRLGVVRVHTRTLAQVSEEHIEEGDVDGAVGSSVVFDLAQHHLDTASQDVGGELPVEVGVLLALEHHVPQLLSQLQLSQVLFQGLGDGIPGSQLIEHHSIVPAHRGQVVQEEDQLLEHLGWAWGW